MSRVSSSTAAAALPSPSAALGAAVRSTDEYAAAFDLEVWKAQQQLRFQGQLRQAKEEMEARLRAQGRETEQRRLAELEGLRQELETMGRRLQAAEETLERRASQLEAREAAFNAKRVRVAEQHEAFVNRAEERERRAREEAQLTQASLHARLQEKDRMLQQLQEKLGASQQELELLRRRAARYLTEQTDTDGPRLREQECALALAHAQLAEMQRAVRDKVAEAERLADDKTALQGQLRETTRQLQAVTRKYHRLSDETQTREWERLRREQDTLEAARRAHTLQLNRGAGQDVAGVHGGTARGASPQLAAGPGRMEGRDEFYDMLSALKREVTAGLATAAAGGRGGGSRLSHSPSSATPLPFRIVERPSAPADGRGSAAGGKGRTAAAGSSSSPSSQPSFCASAAAGCSPADFPDDRDDDEAGAAGQVETSTDSAALSAIAAVPHSPSSPPSLGQTAKRSAAAAALSQSAVPLRAGANVVVDMGDTSLETSYPRAELQSWPHSLAAEDDERAVAPLPPAHRAGTLPPLAPELRGADGWEGRGGSAGSASRYGEAGVVPTPEDFVLAHDVPPIAPLSSASKAAAARRDMEVFVQQLRTNRERLLETGVYGEQDRVVQEMGEKIRMYEEYLAQHHP